MLLSDAVPSYPLTAEAAALGSMKEGGKGGGGGGGGLAWNWKSSNSEMVSIVNIADSVF